MVKINCDLCGRTEEKIQDAIIEGVELSVCTDCSKFGKVIGPKSPPVEKQFRKFPVKEEKLQSLIENYPDAIRKGRELLGLTQRDFAMKINEKESTIHKIETGSLQPELSLVSKLENFLGISLLEDIGKKPELVKRKPEAGMTFGDFIKITSKK